MSYVLEKGRLRKGQEALSTCIGQLRELGLPPLGPDFETMGGSALNDALVVHRLVSKFEVPSGSRSAEKAGNSIKKMLEYDASYNPKSLFKGKGVVKRFLEAKAWLHHVTRDFKPTGLSFPSGEGVVPSNGYVDLYYKLKDDKYWTVSQGCFNDACKIAYKTHALKRLVLNRFREKMGETGQRILRDAYLRKPENSHAGYYCFRVAFGHVVSIYSYSRLTTVPKNNVEDRVITCEPLWNMVVQRSIAEGLKRCLSRMTGINIDTLQDLHRSLIANSDIATVDFSKASDSNWLGVFKILFRKKIVDHVLRARTGLAEYEGEYARFNQLAPMGCGFTFEIMTLTLLAYARTFHKGATVFGDDVIIKARYAPGFIKFAQNMGWKINISKTFVRGNFRESCGGFYNHSTKEHIISHDMMYPETYADVISSANKLANILYSRQIGQDVRKILLLCYHKLLSNAPGVAVSGVRPQDGEEAAYFWALPGLEKHYSTTFKGKFDGEQRQLRKHVVHVNEVDKSQKDIKLLYLTALLYGSHRVPTRKRGSIVYRTIQAHT